MIPYQLEKIENAICFFATEHRKRKRDYLYQTFLWKYLAFLDFESLKETGRPTLELVYRAMQWGPVPIEIYNKRVSYSTPLFDFKQLQKDRYVIVPKKKPILDYFSRYELDLMNRLIEIYADRFVSSNLMSDASHEEIPAWQKTWRKKQNAIIDYVSNFDDNLLKKTDDELSYPEESYLTYMAFK